MSDPKKMPPVPKDDPKMETTPAQEWGERDDTAKAIACGGKEDCEVPGATPAKKSDKKKED